MSYSRTKKETGTEKQIEALKAQLYGKDQLNVKKVMDSNAYTFKSSTNGSIKEESVSQDYNYLHRDLFKISLLAIAAIGVQLLIFILSKQGLIRL